MANEMRDRLVELVCGAIQTDGCIAHCNYAPCIRCEIIADHLIESGVIVPPVNIGSLVYVLRWKRTNGKGGYWNNVIETNRQMKFARENGELFVDCKNATKSDFSRIGKTVFLTKEEAEQKLKEMRGNNKQRS